MQTSIDRNPDPDTLPGGQFDDEAYTAVDATFVDTRGVSDEELWAAALLEDDSLTLAEIVEGNDLPPELRG